jgi:hypothetical protein
MLKVNPSSQALQRLRLELINSVDNKEYYFNHGLLELLLPHLESESIDASRLTDILAIVNSYFFDTVAGHVHPGVLECFRVHSQVFTTTRNRLIHILMGIP